MADWPFGSTSETAADRVLGVAAEWPFEHRDGARAQAEQGQLGLQIVTGRDVKELEPLAQADAEPAREVLLATEVDDVQLAARRQPGQRARQHRLPAWDHRQAVGYEDTGEARDAEQQRRIERGGVGPGKAD